MDSINVMIDDVDIEEKIGDLRNSRMIEKRNSLSNFTGSGSNFKA